MRQEKRKREILSIYTVGVSKNNRNIKPVLLFEKNTLATLLG